jgi:hypothetical protein
LTAADVSGAPASTLPRKKRSPMWSVISAMAQERESQFQSGVPVTLQVESGATPALARAMSGRGQRIIRLMSRT